ncbi:MAG: hypothetical protein ACLSAH_03085 [Bilophila wadsworthia]
MYATEINEAMKLAAARALAALAKEPRPPKFPPPIREDLAWAGVRHPEAL